MAASTSSSSGFSYAQAAKGQASTAMPQAPSSKVTSDAATPAADTFSDLGPNSSWADDVEATVGEKVGSRKTSQDATQAAPVKDSAVERTKSESRAANGGGSGVSTPVLGTASIASNTDESSAPNTTSSETTWETKSLISEPAWIAERKERSINDKPDERASRKGSKKGDKETKEAAQPKPELKPVYTEAAVPSVNIWAKRAEEQKAKAVPVPQLPRATPAVSPALVNKENQKPQADGRKKANSIACIAREAESASVPETKKPQGNRAEVRGSARHNSKPATEDARNDSRPTAPRAAQREAQSLPNLTAVPPPVKDETSWPTPDKAEKAEDKDRKERPTEKEPESNGDVEATEWKPREKTKWQSFAVTPTIVWETEEMNRPRGSGERSGRGGGSARGRGSLRGGPNGSKGDRPPRKEGSQNDTDAVKDASARGRSDNTDREVMPPPTRPARHPTAAGSREASQARGTGQGKARSGIESNSWAQKPMTTFRTKSPELFDAMQDMKLPDPIPRQANDSDAIREVVDAARESGKKFSESKKESRNPDGKEWNGAPRGGKRGGRGRGGSREYTNGHQEAQGFGNGHAELAGPFGVPASPSYPNSRRGFGFSQQGRGSWRGNPRSQSIPLDTAYAQRFAPYGHPHHPLYYPGMYEIGIPVTTMPYGPYVAPDHLMDMVATQLEYYFSMDNLLKDMFLRKNMDSQGFVYLDVIANFNRIKNLTQDKEMLKAVCLRSDTIEIRVGSEDGKLRLRKREGWDQFLLPKHQREASAQTDSQQELRRPESTPAPQAYAYRGNVLQSTGLLDSHHRRFLDPGFGMNGVGPQFGPLSPHAGQYGELTNGDELRGRAPKSPIRDNSVSLEKSFLPGSANVEVEPDVFPDDQICTLTVVVRHTPPGPLHAASRTFSNGSIDTRSIFAEMDKSNDEDAKPQTNGEPLINGDSSGPNIARSASPSQDRSREKSKGKEINVLWAKDKDVPLEQLPENSNLEPYHQLRNKALTQREEAATGACPYDLDVLYQFWAHFLIRNFNNKMYGEFKFFANSDAVERHNTTGMQNIISFYHESLSRTSPIRDHLLKDYVELVRTEHPILQGAAFKKLRQAWRNGALNLKNRKKLADIVDDELRGRLES